jgi:hypothetical protein
MPRVGKESERVADHSGDDLRNHEHDDEQERDGQRPAIRHEPVFVIVCRMERLVARPQCLQPLGKEAAVAPAARTARHVVSPAVRIDPAAAHAVEDLLCPHVQVDLPQASNLRRDGTGLSTRPSVPS